MKNKYNFNWDVDFSVWCLPIALQFENSKLFIGFLCVQLEIEIELIEDL